MNVARAFSFVRWMCGAGVMLAGCVIEPPNGNNNGNDNNNPSEMRLTSPSFQDGGAIPVDFTEDGADISPALNWTNVPEDAAEFALLMDDPDSNSRDPFAHWLIYIISGDATGLPENVAKVAAPPEPAGALQGLNDSDDVGYTGPAPPEDDEPHTYRFRLFALDAPLTISSGRRKPDLFNAMAGHIIAEAVLEGTYGR